LALEYNAFHFSLTTVGVRIATPTAQTSFDASSHFACLILLVTSVLNLALSMHSYFIENTLLLSFFNVRCHIGFYRKVANAKLGDLTLNYGGFY
jgi:hypothetical protein